MCLIAEQTPPPPPPPPPRAPPRRDNGKECVTHHTFSLWSRAQLNSRSSRWLSLALHRDPERHVIDRDGEYYISWGIWY